MKGKFSIECFFLFMKKSQLMDDIYWRENDFLIYFLILEEGHLENLRLISFCQTCRFLILIQAIFPDFSSLKNVQPQKSILSIYQTAETTTNSIEMSLWGWKIWPKIAQQRKVLNQFDKSINPMCSLKYLTKKLWSMKFNLCLFPFVRYNDR